MLKSIGFVTFTKIIIQTIGFIITIIVARRFGIGNDIGVYFYAYGIVLTPVVIFNLSARSLVVTELNLHQFKRVDLFSSFVRFLIKFSIISAGIATFLLIFIVELNSYLGFLTLDDDLFKRVVYFLLPMSFILMLSEILTGVFNSKKTFGWPEVTEIIKVLITLLSLVLFSEVMGIFSLVLGSVFGSLVSASLLFCVIKKKYLITKGLTSNISESIVDFKSRFYGLASSNIMIAIQPVIITSYISLIGIHSVSTYSYMVKIVSIPSFILASTIYVAFSHWSDFASKQENEKIKNSSLTVLLAGSIIIGVFLAVFILEGNLIIQILFGDDDYFDYNDFLYLSVVLIVSSLLQFSITTLTRIMQALRMVKHINIYRLVFFLVSLSIIQTSFYFLEGGLDIVVYSLLAINIVMLMYVIILLYIKEVIEIVFVLYIIKVVSITVALALVIPSFVESILGYMIIESKVIRSLFSIFIAVFVYLSILSILFKNTIQEILKNIFKGDHYK